ncbi:hypothetical protein RHECNPAF_430028 [Rhizobium etli CNPAF512]|nr:hypothetical protein RHECNPAF_430028 [Rhizobium etli CNPAF512]
MWPCCVAAYFFSITRAKAHIGLKSDSRGRRVGSDGGRTRQAACSRLRGALFDQSIASAVNTR